MLEICNLVKKFGPVVAVDNVSFSVPAGEVLGLISRIRKFCRTRSVILIATL